MMACYGRVSSRSQQTDSQKAELLRWRQPQGFDSPAGQWFEDIARGQTRYRPAFARLQRAIATGTITMVVLWKRDRLARRPPDGSTLVADGWARNGRVGAGTPQIDLSGPVGRMVARVLFGLAEIEWA
jgi:DNA invertase Pin-like site-specific DNA recombinase